MSLNLDHLHAFLVIVEEGSINRAAVRLRRAQPAVGRQIKLLEASLRTVLLDRSSSGVAPTYAGLALIEHAKRIFQDVADAQAAMARAGTEPAGDLCVAIPTSLVDQLGPSLFLTMQERHPLIRLTLIEGDSHRVVSAVRSGEADIAVLPDGGADPSLHAQRCGRQVFCFCGAAADAEVLPTSMLLADALNFPLALSAPPNRLRQLIDAAAEGIGAEVQPVLNSGSSHLITQLVRQGKVFTVRPRIGIAPAVVDGIGYVPIAAPEIARDINIVWSTARSPDAATEAARIILQDLMAGLA